MRENVKLGVKVKNMKEGKLIEETTGNVDGTAEETS